MGAQESLKLNGLFSHGMIFQQQAKDPIFGTATPGTKVVVKINGTSYGTYATSAGIWKVLVPIGGAGPAFSFEVTALSI